MLSHADLHPIPDEELPSEHREQIDRVFAAQERGVQWSGKPPIRYLEMDGVTFIREDASNRLPEGVKRAAAFGAAGFLCALLGASSLNPDGIFGEVMLLLGGLCFVGCVWWLIRYPKDQAALRDGPTRRGIYLLNDALVTVGEPQQVIHRPERCGALMFARGAITRVDVVSVRTSDSVRYNAAIRVRKTTGEFVEHAFESCPSATGENPLREIIGRWLEKS
jgi:hypothetical protein